jgi:Porphyromonas-type peptidyl-arginine deiminase
VADYEATDSVQLHSLARDLAPEFSKALFKRLGSNVQMSHAGYGGPRGGFSNPNIVWLRDFSPLYVRKDGSVEARKFLSLDPQRQQFTGEGQSYGRAPSPQHRYLGPEKARGFVKVEEVPLLIDGGDLVPVGETLIVGERVFQRNAETHSERHLLDAGYEPRNAQEVTQLLQEATGAEKVVVLPWWPGDKTGHVDMPVQALAEGEVMVPEVRDEAISVLDYAHEKSHGSRVQGYLNGVATSLAEAGLKVQRLPMMAPVDLQEGPYGWDGKSYTPANAYRGPDVIFLPTFDTREYSQSYQDIKAGFEAEWGEFYNQRGLDTEVVESTDLGRANGLFHCLTASIPAVNGKT